MAGGDARADDLVRLRRSRQVLMDLLWWREEEHRLSAARLAAENARLRRRVRWLSAELRRKSETSR
jgi:hypothetical protein